MGIVAGRGQTKKDPWGEVHTRQVVHEDCLERLNLHLLLKRIVSHPARTLRLSKSRELV